MDLAASRAVAPGSRCAGARCAGAVFALLVVAAGPIIAYLNRDQWFYGDDFAFLLKRDLADPASMLEPHWGHLTVLPAAIYQGLYRTVGLGHYWPYQWLVIGAHLCVAVLLRALMRRSGVGGWLATAAATTFLFLGSGRENLEWGFQITLTGSIAFGLGAILVLVAERRRGDLAAAALLIGSIACSNVGVLLAGVVGLASLLLGRGWKRTALVVAPAALLYGTWSVAAPPSEFSVPSSAPADAVDFAWSAGVAALRGLFRFDVVVALALLAVVFAVVRIARHTDPAARRAFGVPAALAVGALAGALMLGYARAADSFVSPGTSRYVYLLVSLVIVPVTVAVSELVRDRGPLALAAGCALLLVGLPGNAADLGPDGPLERDRLGDAVATAHLAALAASSDLADHEVLTGELRVGDLARAHREGRLPEPDAADHEAAARAELLLAFGRAMPAERSCRAVEEAETLLLETGQALSFQSSIVVERVRGGRTVARIEVSVAREDPVVLPVRWGPGEVRASSPGAQGVELCG